MDIFSTLFPYEFSVGMFGLVTVVASFAIIAAAEVVRPARRGSTGRDGRITLNFGLGLINMVISMIIPLSALGAAGWAIAHQWGLFQIMPVGWYVAVPLLLLAKSLLAYALHWLFHRVSWLWPFHAVHHRDDAIDLSTSFRTHPISYILVLLSQTLLVFVLGPDIWDLLIAEAVLWFAALFQHANVELPENANNKLENWLVTPRMHLLHHARDRHFHDSNYGEIFSFWDHIFGTYRTPPKEPFAIGVEAPAKSS